MKKHPSHAAPVVARAQMLSPGRTRCHPRACRRRRKSAEVWGVCEKTPLPRGTRRRTGACILTRAQAFPPGRTRRRLSEDALSERRRLWLPNDTCVRAQALSPAPAPSVPEPQRVFKGPGFPSLLTFLPSEASWPGPALQQLLARTSWIGLFLFCYLFM